MTGYISAIGRCLSATVMCVKEPPASVLKQAHKLARERDASDKSIDRSRRHIERLDADIKPLQLRLQYVTGKSAEQRKCDLISAEADISRSRVPARTAIIAITAGVDLIVTVIAGIPAIIIAAQRNQDFDAPALPGFISVIVGINAVSLLVAGVAYLTPNRWCGRCGCDDELAGLVRESEDLRTDNIEQLLASRLTTLLAERASQERIINGQPADKFA